MRTTLYNVRLSYAKIWDKNIPEDGGKPYYSTAVLVRKDDADSLKKLETAINAAKQEGVRVFGGKIPPNLHLPIRDGDTERPNDPDYAGCYFFTCKSYSKIDVVDRFVNPIFDREEIYSGCYVNIAVNTFAYNKNGNTGISIGLGNIQKVKDGPKLGGGGFKAEDDFQVITPETAENAYPWE
jgi:hypothetical protein